MQRVSLALYRVRDLLDSLYRGYPSERSYWGKRTSSPLQEFAVKQEGNPDSDALLLDGPATFNVAGRGHPRVKSTCAAPKAD